MSVNRVNVFSTSLLRTVDVTVILPVEKNIDNPSFEYKTLYLLHGVFGSDIDWLFNTRIKLWADEYDLAVVMPSGENGCYVDNPAGLRNYSQFVGQELVNITRHMFPLSTKREDTFIAGLSMGGFGALLNGLKFNDTFSHIGAFSAALVTETSKTDTAALFPPGYFEQTFGCAPEEVRETMCDPRYAFEHLKGEVPKIYLTCGTEDFVLSSTTIMHEYFEENGVNHEYVLEPGTHDWYFWDKKVLDFLEWLPIEKTLPPMSSGNVPGSE